MSKGKKTTISIFLSSVMVVSVLLAFVPSASAQAGAELAYEIKNVPSEPITPITEQPSITLDYRYTVKGNLPQSTIGGFTGTAQLDFTFDCTPNELIVTGATSVIIPITTEAGETSATFEGTPTVQITPTRQAPGMELIQCNVSGQVSEVGTPASIPASNEQTQRFSVTPDFFSLIEASAPVKLRQGGPQKEVPYTIDVVNFGNSQTRVVFKYAEGGTPSSGKWKGLLPDPLILDRQGGDRATAQATFTVTTDYKTGWNNDEGQFIVTLTPEYALDSQKKGGEQSITFLTRVRGVYVPTLEPFLMVGAALASAFVARRMGSDEDEE